MKNFLIISISLLLASCAEKPLSFKKVGFEAVPETQTLNTEAFKRQFIQNCSHISKRLKTTHHPIFATPEKWNELCSKVSNKTPLNVFIQNNFDVYEVVSKKEGLFTGYYAPYFEGSLTKTDEYQIPIRQKPTDIYTLKMKSIDDENEDTSYIVRVNEKTKTIERYYERKDIQKSDAKPIVWLKSPVDAFFLQIQGSGFIKLENGQTFHVAYAGSNGHNYRAIGRYLIKRGYISKNDVTMESIRTFLENNPSKVPEIFNLNPRYIFFGKGDGHVKGSLNVPLQPESSLAVDPSYIPLGLPVFVKTSRNYDNHPLQKWMFAEDTGAAIKGGLRGDIYFGQGEQAGKFAGAQNASGKMYVIVPKE